MTIKGEKPRIIYVDDDPRNVSLVELSCPDDRWDILCFSSAVEALKEIKDIDPAVIVSDQRMPQMTGLEFLTICAQMVPDSVRMIVTGQTADSVIIDLIRHAKIFDYIVKPWSTDDFVARVQKGADFYSAFTGSKALVLALEEKNKELLQSRNELLELKEKESGLRKLFEGWIPWPIANALKSRELTFPFRTNIACLVFDIIQSSKLANKEVNGRGVRARIMQLFKEEVIRHGGLNESQGGDASYAHFGAFATFDDPCRATFHTAQGFKGRLRRFSQTYQVDVECGIALHYVRDALIEKDVVTAELPNGLLCQEYKVHSQSPQIDLVHRLEKLVHSLPGTNILATSDYLDRFPDDKSIFTRVGDVLLRGQTESVEVFLLPSDVLEARHIEDLKKEINKVNADTQLVKRQAI